MATKNKWARIEQLQRNKTFQKMYRAAYKLWRSRSPEARFPWGTYKLMIQAQVSCHPPPQSTC